MPRAAATAATATATGTRRAQRRVGDVRRRRARSPERRAERGGVREAPSIFFERIGSLVGIEGDQCAHDRTIGAISHNLGPFLEQVHRPASAHLMREAIRGHQRSSEVIRGHQGSSGVIRGHQRT